MKSQRPDQNKDLHQNNAKVRDNLDKEHNKNKGDKPAPKKGHKEKSKWLYGY